MHVHRELMFLSKQIKMHKLNIVRRDPNEHAHTGTTIMKHSHAGQESTYAYSISTTLILFMTKK